jgi:hypothetical protein
VAISVQDVATAKNADFLSSTIDETDYWLLHEPDGSADVQLCTELWCPMGAASGESFQHYYWVGSDACKVRRVSETISENYWFLAMIQHLARYSAL